MQDTLKILILGGYGTFGGRLAQLLADEPRLTMVIAGRSLAKAKAFCHALPAAAALIPHLFDRDGDLEAQIKAVAPDAVVDATGPFQNYGENPYRVMEACLRIGAHYLDLADGSDFVRGVSRFDGEAKARGVFLLSGVSSFPVLTAAVVRELAQGLRQFRSIRGGIAPSPYAGVGENVIRAIAGYAGQPVKLTRGAKQATGFALTETMRYTIAPPGRLPLHNTRFSLVDVPDLQIIPEEWPGLDSIWMGAGPVPELLHRALNGLSWLVRLKILPSLLPLAGLFYRAINILRWGEDRGGMFVEIEGTDSDGHAVTRSWHLLAEGRDGPMIPSMAVEAVIRRVLAAEPPPPGARAGTHDVTLADYDALFKRRTIHTGRRDASPGAAPLYRRVLGDAWQALPQAICGMHDLRGAKTVAGVARVDRGSGRAAQWIADRFGFPQAGESIPVRVDFSLTGGKERWQRTFAGTSFQSVQSEGRGRWMHLVCERFGIFTFGLALVVQDNELHLIVRRWSVLGFPLPLFLAPRGKSYEDVENGKFRFHVEIRLPVIGLLVKYEGWLA